MTTPTDPSVCYATSLFGFGPFPEPGQTVVVCPYTAMGSGYGGVGWAPATGGAAYGLMSFGDFLHASPTLAVNGGFGGDPFGLGPYGGTEKEPPRPLSAVSLNGFQIELFFSEEMDPDNPYLVDPFSYTLTPLVGAPSTVTQVVIGQIDPVSVIGGDTVAGVLSVILTHTGTTLGGTYQIVVDGPTDIAGNPILNIPVFLLTMGETPSYAVTAISGEHLLFTFSQPMLPEAEEPPGGNGILDPASYGFTSVPTYPITLTPVRIKHPYNGDASQVAMQVEGMTSLTYTSNISPALAMTYDGSILPSAATDFLGVEEGVGTSSVVSGHLNMSRDYMEEYGWAFLDTSGKMAPTDSTFRVDFTFNAGAATYYPPLIAFAAPQVGMLIIEDGPSGVGVRIQITLLREPGGDDRIRVQSGSYDVLLVAAWSTGTNTLTFLRNIKAGLYSFLLNGTPLASTATVNCDQPATGSGAGVTWQLLAQDFKVTDFQVRDLVVTSSTTVYSAAWNFLHEAMDEFVGSAALARDYLLTDRGPLVKGWGDGTPATRIDVKVRVNGGDVKVSEVNPYLGRVELEVPVPLLPPGHEQGGAEVDYTWMVNPIMVMGGLNVPGVVLNQWDRRNGHHDPAAHGEQIQDDTHPKGAAGITRFPYSIVIGPMDRPDPLLIGHRYMGFEKGYTASLNSPTSLLLNQSPYQDQVPAFERFPQGIAVSFEGLTTPVTASPVWVLEGADAGFVDVNEGTYTLVDDLSGTALSDTAAVYWRGLDLTFPSSVSVVARFQVEDAASLLKTTNTNILSPDGVFTGVGFGIHNDHELYLVGALLVNGVEHIGVLLDPRQLQYADAWLMGPQVKVSITAKDTFTVSTALIPLDLEIQDRFQILSGGQTGVYTITQLIHQCDGSTTFTVSPDFPGDYTKYEIGTPTILFETKWSENPSTYRLTVDPETKTAQLMLSGEVTTTAITLDSTRVTLPSPADMSLLLSAVVSTGQVFWGSLSRLATNRSRWSFMRYGVIPDQTTIRGYNYVITAAMSDLPEDDPHYEWYKTQTFGYTKLDTGTGGMLLRATSSNQIQDTTFGYARTEPFLTRDANLDMTSRFAVTFGTQGYGDGMVVIRDTEREVRLSTLFYLEGMTGLEYRELLSLPLVSFTGLYDPVAQGWTKDANSTGSAENHLTDLVLTQTAGQTIRYITDLAAPDTRFNDVAGRRLAFHMAVDSYTARLDGLTGIYAGADGLGTAYVGVRFRAGAIPQVELVTAMDVTIQAYPVAWNDGEMHAYTLLIGPSVVILYVDDVMQTPTAVTANFPGGGGASCILGAHNQIAGAQEATLASVVRWRSASYAVMAPIHLTSDPVPAGKYPVKRSYGIWTGGDPTHINSWEMPRTDTSTAPNSSSSAVIEVMDWSLMSEVRLLRTPNWGVTMFRTDLPLPTYYSPETPGVPGSGYATQVTEPSAGWINVEYDALPLVPTAMGEVQFGALDSRTVSDQFWEFVQYRLFKPLTDDLRSSEKMVLNQSNVIASGELTRDWTLETVQVQALDQHSVSLHPAHMNADVVFKILDGAVIYTSESWTFDRENQLITLGLDPITGNPLEFSSPTTNLTIIFQPGKPVTSTYLSEQPLLDSVTQLNEGTPPVPTGQTRDSEREVIFGSLLNDDNGVLNDTTYLLNDPYTATVFRDDPNALYEGLTFMEVTNSGQEGIIALPGEEMLPEGFSGWTPDEGEEQVYSPTGTGTPLGGVGASAGLNATGVPVGKTVGAHALEFSGTKFWELAKAPQQPDFSQKGGMPGGILFASGGSYMGPVVDLDGNILPQMQPLGGTLGPGTSVLYPAFPSVGRRGEDLGKIYRQTFWYLRLSSVLVGGGSAGASAGASAGGSLGESLGGSAGWDGLVNHPLIEDGMGGGSDNTPPSRPYTWYRSPDGPPAPSGRGACYSTMLFAGNYSHIGPWGGMSSLIPDPDYAFIEFWGLLQDGDTVTLREESGATTVVFVARAVPVAPNEFSMAPNPHTSLALTINTHPVSRGLVQAVAGLGWSNQPVVEVTAYDVVSTTNYLTLQSSVPGVMRVISLEPSPSGAHLLSGGAKITQSSLLAGGDRTIRDGAHDPLLGMVCLGGAALPPGSETSRILYAP